MFTTAQTLSASSDMLSDAGNHMTDTTRNAILRTILSDRRRELQREIQNHIRDGRTDRLTDVGDDLEVADTDIQGDIDVALPLIREIAARRTWVAAAPRCLRVFWLFVLISHVHRVRGSARRVCTLEQTRSAPGDSIADCQNPHPPGARSSFTSETRTGVVFVSKVHNVSLSQPRTLLPLGFHQPRRGQ
jgi:hypothetical protein